MRISEQDAQTRDQDGLATIDEACRFLRVGRTLVYQLLTEHRLTSCKVGGARRIPWSALRQFISENSEK
jgi:excisionase family DNA binding protein